MLRNNLSNNMKKEELSNLTRVELEEMFTDLINAMESDGERYMTAYKKDTERVELHAYAAALLTKVNYIKAKISMNVTIWNDQN